MPDNQLELAYDDGDPDWFVVSELDVATNQQKAARLLPANGFELEHLRDAMLATGWVRQDDGRLLLRRGTLVETLRDIVGEMFEYFSAPNVPTQELLDIRAAVDAFDVVQQADVPIALFAYAWLDIAVREDLAEEVRNSGSVWQESQLAVDIENLRQRRVEQLVDRYQRDATGSSRNRMAPSARQRQRNDQSSKLG